MKATIKRIINDIDETCIKVFADDSFFSSGIFYFSDDKTEKEAFEKALKLAKKIEENKAEEKILYETGIQPIDYFTAANMDEEILSNHLKNVM